MQLVTWTGQKSFVSFLQSEKNSWRTSRTKYCIWKVVRLMTLLVPLAIRTQEFGQGEPVMIISSDKDFIQLQKYNNVKQFSPIQKKAVVDKNPRNYLFNHIMRGDCW